MKIIIILITLLLTGCGSGSEKSAILLGAIEACKPGSNAILKVHMGQWDNSATFTCDWIVKDE